MRGLACHQDQLILTFPHGVNTDKRANRIKSVWFSSDIVPQATAVSGAKSLREPEFLPGQPTTTGSHVLNNEVGEVVQKSKQRVPVSF